MLAPGLTPVQDRLLTRWLPGAHVVEDLSWSARLTVVLRLATPTGDDLVVKAGGPVTGHHIAREVDAGRVLTHLGPGLPTLLAGSPAVRALVLRHQPGHLVQGTVAERDPEVHRSAGALLARVHTSAPSRLDLRYPKDRLARLHRLLDRVRTLLDARTARALAAAVTTVDPVPEPVVRTHGDVQPRNWLLDPAPATETDRRAGPHPEGGTGADPRATARRSVAADPAPATGPSAPGTVSLIDFGRYARRPWYSDLVRLVAADGTEGPLTAAFLVGLARPAPWGPLASPVERAGWRTEHLYQGVATLVWATDVDDLTFADDGRAMIRAALDGP